MQLFAGVDINAATKQKIKVARIPGSTTGNAIACAEMAIYLTLGVLRKQVRCMVVSFDLFEVFCIVELLLMNTECIHFLTRLAPPVYLNFS
jgi:hypothetical protein